MITIESLLLAAHDWVPNNPHLPVIVYRRAIAVNAREKTAKAFEQAFDRNGWPARWRDGIYDYHHYHSTAHEALGIAAGSAILTIGGPGGRDLTLGAGDSVVLPVGTGHRCVDASDNFLVVGGYPRGQDWDICRTAPSAETLARMRDLAGPSMDPLCGEDGPLVEHWA